MRMSRKSGEDRVREGKTNDEDGVSWRMRKATAQLAMVYRTCNRSSREAEAAGLYGQSQTGLLSPISGGKKSKQNWCLIQVLLQVDKFSLDG